MMTRKLLILTMVIFTMNHCTKEIPNDATEVNEEVSTYPDVKDVTIPKNLAPLNFIIENEGEECIVELSDKSGKKIVTQGNGQKEILFNEKEWGSLISGTEDDEIECKTYIKRKSKWSKLNTFKINILNQPIDSFITYRLIEPSFMSTGQIGLYQFNLMTGEETVIMRRCKNFTKEKVHEQSCVNCHCAQKGNPKNKMFYYRGDGGGLMLTYNGKLSKINTKVEGMFCGTTYPTWHPTLPFIVFSENDVKQDFPTIKKGKTEFYDKRTDLILYDIEKNEIFIVSESKQLETNPSWSPDGEYLYFALSDSLMDLTVYPEYEYPKLKYDIARTKFDPQTKSFSKPEIVLNITKDNRSATFPRISPDKKFLLTVISDYGASPHTHQEADLYAMNLETKELIKCDAANSNESESYHDFSSKANWFVFYSRREDGNYGRAYISYLDSTGKTTKPFQLPHKNPQMDHKRLKLYNMIEFANSAVTYSEADFYDLVWNHETIQAQKDPRNLVTDGNTSATYVNDRKNNTDANTSATKLNKGAEGNDGYTGASAKNTEIIINNYQSDKNIHE